jgi:tetratricopeptide (TPR) repeat protein
MTTRFGPRQVVLGILAAGVLGVGILLVAAVKLRGRPSLESLPPLLAAGRFDDVEATLRAFLEIEPGHATAHMLMAQASLARPDPKPRLALEHLRKVGVTGRQARAIVRLNEGKAYSALGRQNLAEEAWLNALRLDPLVPEAGWNLLGLYQSQGRREDAHDLAMRLFRREPDLHDRAQLLLELLRQDVQPISASSLIATFEPAVRAHPDDLYSAIALGRAYVASSRPEEGLPILLGLVERFPDSAAAWDALLAGLDESSLTDELAAALDRLPQAVASAPRLARHRGALALRRRDWPRAVQWYRRARSVDPSEGRVLYRLCVALRAAGLTGELGELDSRFRALEAARERALPLYEEADAVSTLGTGRHRDLYHRIASLREAMGRTDEALAWYRLVLEHEPGDATSRAEVERLAREAGDQEALPRPDSEGLEQSRSPR